jgi:hypothetical protein
MPMNAASKNHALSNNRPSPVLRTCRGVMLPSRGPNGQREVQQQPWRAMCHIIGLTNDHVRLEAVNRPKGRHHAAEKLTAFVATRISDSPEKA